MEVLADKGARGAAHCIRLSPSLRSMEHRECYMKLMHLTENYALHKICHTNPEGVGGMGGRAAEFSSKKGGGGGGGGPTTYSGQFVLVKIFLKGDALDPPPPWCLG